MADLTLTERANIRYYLGWTFRFRQQSSKLEFAMDAINSESQTDGEVTVVIIRDLITKIAAIETEIGKMHTRFKADVIGSITLNKQELDMLRSEGTRFCAQMAGILGVPVVHNIFSSQAPKYEMGWFGKMGSGSGNLPPLGQCIMNCNGCGIENLGNFKNCDACRKIHAAYMKEYNAVYRQRPEIKKQRADYYQSVKEVIRIKNRSKPVRDSSGVRRIKKFLKLNNIVFIPEKRFDDCRDKIPMPFDFYIPASNTLIEFDGAHHYYIGNTRKKDPVDAQKKLETTQKHDKMKDKWADNNNVTLIRIKYDVRNIEEILNKKLFGYLLG